MELNDESTSASLRHKLKQSFCFSCCFGRRRHFPLHSPPPMPSDENPKLIWIESTNPQPHDQQLSDVKEMCCSIFRIAGAKHRRHASVEFSYDPLSYARNFEDGFEFEDDAAPLKSFSARLPPSPPLPAAVS